MLQKCIVKECAVSKAAFIGHAETPCSMIFQNELISAEGVPAGVFIQNIKHLVSSQHSTTSLSILHLLARCSNDVRTVILFPAPKSTTFCDPRETIAESWFEVACAVSADCTQEDTVKERFLADMMTTLFYLILMSSTAKTQDERSQNPVMSFDGPQTLAMISFLSAFLSQKGRIVSSVLKTVAMHLPVHSSIQLDTEQFPFVLLLSLLFRGCSGALPPWAIEAMPELYSLVFDATGRNPEMFCFLLRASVDMKTTEQLGDVALGKPIAGPLFHTMPEKIKDSFSAEACMVLHRNSANKWREIKAIVKRLCGGKKKETDYGQKPHYTKWDFDRV